MLLTPVLSGVALVTEYIVLSLPGGGCSFHLFCVCLFLFFFPSLSEKNKINMTSSQDLNLGLLNSSQML